MATQNKTAFTEVAVPDFIESFVTDENKKRDSYRLIDLMREWSGHEPKMYGPSIVGFGRYVYTYASGHGGDAPLIGFSPRKAEFSLYVTNPEQDNSRLLEDLGKYKMGKACIYFKKLDDLDLGVLEQLCRRGMAFLDQKYGLVN